jgi:hypothetical protein
VKDRKYEVMSKEETFCEYVKGANLGVWYQLGMNGEFSFCKK